MFCSKLFKVAIDYYDNDDYGTKREIHAQKLHVVEMKVVGRSDEALQNSKLICSR